MQDSLFPELPQMTWRRFLILLAAVAGTAAFIQAQPQDIEHPLNKQPTFKEHRIGESSQEFFAIAKMAQKNGMLSTDYCRSYLNDPKVKKALEKIKKKGERDPSLLVTTMDVAGCDNIRAALAGQDVEIEVRFAAEFGSGTAHFIAGRLASVSFVVKAQFNDVVEDMTAKLDAKPQVSVETVQNAVGAILKQHRAKWILPNTLVKLSEVQSLEGNSIGTEVSVSDPAILKHRSNSLN
jgi:hypothetical protein